MRMLGDREDAEEALQDAFVRAYRSLARCDDGARFGPWLFAILVNRCRTAGRRTRDATASSSGTAYPLNRHLPRRSRSGTTRWLALGRLAPGMREAFLLKHVEDLDYDEMSRLTGAGVSALKMRVKRACEQPELF
jgi:RNA polymerase sigma-70 factor (ECF subfamily)